MSTIRELEEVDSSKNFVGKKTQMFNGIPAEVTTDEKGTRRVSFDLNQLRDFGSFDALYKPKHDLNSENSSLSNNTIEDISDKDEFEIYEKKFPVVLDEMGRYGTIDKDKSENNSQKVIKNSGDDDPLESNSSLLNRNLEQCGPILDKDDKGKPPKDIEIDDDKNGFESDSDSYKDDYMDENDQEYRIASKKSHFQKKRIIESKQSNFSQNRHS